MDRLLRAKVDPAAFRELLFIERNGKRVPLVEVLDPYQAEDFAACGPGWRVAMGCAKPGDEDHPRRQYIERGRGGSKTSDFATYVAWAVFNGKPGSVGVILAADKDQGKLVVDAVERLVQQNPWLGEYIDVQKFSVRNRHTEAACQVISCDHGSSYGLLPNYVVCDEFVHWGPAGEQLFASMLSAAGKKPSALLLVLTNAGWGTGWEWSARESARTSSRWFFHSLPIRPSWISPEDDAELERMMPRFQYERLILNLWTTGSGDALSPEDIARATCLAGPMKLPLSLADRERYVFLAGLDLGVRRDHSALVTLGVDRETRSIHLARVDHCAPARGQSVDLVQVEQTILEVHSQFHLQALHLDPWQGLLMAQRLRRRGLVCHETYFSGRVLNDMATCLLETFRDGSVSLFEGDGGLIADLHALKIQEQAFGLKLTSIRDSSGHGDRGTAFLLALLPARGLLRQRAQPTPLSQAAPILQGANKLSSIGVYERSGREQYTDWDRRKKTRFGIPRR